MNAENISESDRTHIAYTFFCAAMENRQYGAEETLDAWLWFKKGFDASTKENRRQTLAMYQRHDAPLLAGD